MCLLCIGNSGLGLFLLRRAHARLHAALELDGSRTLRVGHAHAHALGQSLLDVVVDAIFGKASRCLLRGHVDRAMITHDWSLLLCRHNFVISLNVLFPLSKVPTFFSDDGLG